MNESTPWRSIAGFEQSKMDMDEVDTEKVDTSEDIADPSCEEQSADDDAEGIAERGDDTAAQTARPSNGTVRLDEIGQEDEGDAENAAPPRLIRRPTAAASSAVRFTSLDEDDGDDNFGPTLAAWLADYRDRQNGIDPRRDGEAKDTSGGRDDDTADDGDLNARAAGGFGDVRWTGRAQGALNDMLDSMTTERPPDWLAPHHRHEHQRARRSRIAAMTAVATLAVGVAAVAVVAAARTSGVRIGMSGITPPHEVEAVVEPRALATGPTMSAASIAGSVRLANQQPDDELPPPRPTPEEPAQPMIVVQPTRVLSASLGVAKADAGVALSSASPTAAMRGEPIEARRSTLILPSTEASNGAETVDHPLAARPPQEPRRQVATESAERLPASAAVQDSGQSSPVRIASLRTVPTELAMAEPKAVADKPVTAIDLGLLIARAETLFEHGEVVAARLLFEQAARAGDPRGARGAGATHDPVRFQQIGVHGIESDPEVALAWYTSALNAGEKSVSDDIDALKRWMGR